MRRPIFISYKRVDKERVFEIKDFIELQTGLSCWIDLVGIESDAQFEDVIIEAIDNCDVFLYFYSKEHTKIINYENDWTIKELDFAQEEEKRIVFINLDKTPLTKKFKFRYRQKQQVDALDKSRLEKLIFDLKKWYNIKNDGLGVKEHETLVTEDLKDEVVEELVKELKDDKKDMVSDSPTNQRLPRSLLFTYNQKNFYMVLSEDGKYYLGNLNAKENDLSWWENKWVQTLGSSAICAGAVLLGVIGIPIAILAGFKALSVIFADEERTGSTSELIVNQELCKKINECTGYIFSVPFSYELNGVKPDMQKGCVVLRVRNNKKLLFSNRLGY